jgi:ABC-type transport system involved in multi-copper enzyme maturation permease subunit
MSEMVRRFLRQKLTSVGIWIALGLLCLLAAIPLNSNQGLGPAATLAILILAAGSVSRDIGSGALQMILSRPLTRLEYLFGRYIGILLAYSIFLVSTAAIAFALGRLAIRLATVYSGPVFSLSSAAHSVLEAFSAGALLAAIVLFFSTFLRGWGDVLALIIATVLLASTQPLGFALNKPGIAKAGQVAIQNLYPSLPWDLLLQGRQILSEASGRYVLALCAYFVIAALVFTRREFSYGQD